MTRFDLAAGPDVIPDDWTRHGDRVASGPPPKDWARGGGVRVWHWCDYSVWFTDPTKDPELIPSPRWAPAGCANHTLVSAEPLHLEPSIYWPDCCGLHGFIRGGEWVGA